MPWNKDGSRKQSAFYKMKGPTGTGNYDITTKTKDQSVKQADIVKKKKSIKK